MVEQQCTVHYRHCYYALFIAWWVELSNKFVLIIQFDDWCMVLPKDSTIRLVISVCMCTICRINIRLTSQRLGFVNTILYVRFIELFNYTSLNEPFCKTISRIHTIFPNLRHWHRIVQFFVRINIIWSHVLYDSSCDSDTCNVFQINVLNFQLFYVCKCGFGDLTEFTLWHDYIWR